MTGGCTSARQRGHWPQGRRRAPWRRPAAVVREVLTQQLHALTRAAQNVAEVQRYLMQPEFSPRPAGEPGRAYRAAVQATGAGVDDASGQMPGWVGEEHDEHGGLFQAADPCLRAGQAPPAVVVRRGGGGGGMDLTAPPQAGRPPGGRLLAMPHYTAVLDACVLVPVALIVFTILERHLPLPGHVAIVACTACPLDLIL